ncbi:MAG TPA: class E sortase [Acidimicrobiales bacterium]
MSARRVSARRVIGGIGRFLILMGTLVLLFVAYQLWGTAIAEARSQNSLRSEFEATLGGEVPDATAITSTTTSSSTTSTTEASATTTTTVLPVGAPPPPEGEALAVLQIPKIGLDKAVVEGVAVSDLKKGPGHYPGTPLPGQQGNAGLAGHRTTYGAPFHRLDELETGDPIHVTTLEGTFTYRVTEQLIVTPADVYVLGDYGDNRLTLTTCNPKYSARERLIVHAVLEGDPVGVAPEPEPEPDEPDDVDEPVIPGQDDPDVPVDQPDISEVAHGFDLGGDPAARGPAVAWGLLAALVLVGEWAAARWWRRWPSYLGITPVFLLVLFMFFENFARLLPANI